MSLQKSAFGGLRERNKREKPQVSFLLESRDIRVFVFQILKGLVSFKRFGMGVS
jgi:hypothetical protein